MDRIMVQFDTPELANRCYAKLSNVLRKYHTNINVRQVGTREHTIIRCDLLSTISLSKLEDNMKTVYKKSVIEFIEGKLNELQEKPLILAIQLLPIQKDEKITVFQIICATVVDFNILKKIKSIDLIPNVSLLFHTNSIFPLPSTALVGAGKGKETSVSKDRDVFIIW